jgi:hypothetical protein
MNGHLARRLRALPALFAICLPLAAQTPPQGPPKKPATLEELQQRVEDLEKAAQASGMVLPQDQLRRGPQSPIRDRDGLYDRQVAAARLDDLTLDPDYRGFIVVPNTGMIMRFNAKPRLDANWDNRNAGNGDRFVPALIPVRGEPNYGGGSQFSLNSNGTQLSIDVRAPHSPGNFRFYYQNDFYNEIDKDMKYRLQHAYGQYYNIVAGFTYSVFEDPDIWPDTVDYEDINSVIFARRPVMQYKVGLAEAWQLTLGVENPDIFVDQPPAPAAQDVTRVTRRPDLGFNVRWEDEKWGHSQFSAMLRSIGANGTSVGAQSDDGWGVNWSIGLNVTEGDTVQFLAVYGEGIGGMGNDTSFLNSDGGYTASGQLEALGYYSLLFGFTHHWNDAWRSTATFGYAELDNSSGQSPTFYHNSTYASLNTIYSVGPRLSVGGEVLYGHNERFNGQEGEATRVVISMVYSIF